MKTTNKLIGITVTLAVCGAMTAQAVPVYAGAQAKIDNAQNGQFVGAWSADAGVQSVSPGVRDMSSTLVTQAMAPPANDTGPSHDSAAQAAAVFEDAAPDVSGGPVAGSFADAAAVTDGLSALDEISAANEGSVAEHVLVVTEPAGLLLWLAGLVAFFARRR